MTPTKNDELVHRRYGGATKLLTYLSGGWCGISLLAISVAMTGNSAYQIRELLLKSGDIDAHFLGGLTSGGGLGLLIVLALGVASGRFLLRALPPTISDQGRRSRSWALPLYTAFICLYIFPVIFLALGLANDAAKPGGGDSTARPGVAVAILGMALLLATVWANGAIGLLIRRHRRPRFPRPAVRFVSPPVLHLL